jgi:hypothetical protein
MKFKTLMTVKAVVCLGFGPLLLFFPAWILNLLGLAYSSGAALTSREYGAALVGNLLLAWLARNTQRGRGAPGDQLGPVRLRRHRPGRHPGAPADQGAEPAGLGHRRHLPVLHHRLRPLPEATGVVRLESEFVLFPESRSQAVRVTRFLRLSL